MASLGNGVEKLLFQLPQLCTQRLHPGAQPCHHSHQPLHQAPQMSPKPPCKGQEHPEHLLPIGHGVGGRT